MNFSRNLVVAALTAGAIAVGGANARAQDYPSHPVTIVVPFAPGGGNDAMARLIAQHMGPALGQQFVIENRAGAGGNIGARQVAHAAPDGYTLLVGNSGVFGVGPSLYANAGFDPRKDFSAIGLIAAFQQVVVVHPSLPIHSLGELLVYARKNPGKLNFASAGVGSGSHISTELFASMAGIVLTHVPYRGTGPAMSDLIGGHVAMTITTIGGALGQIRSGLLRPLAVTGAARSPVFPDLPTAAEAGVPGYVAVIHYGLVAPAGTPGVIIAKLNAALRGALATDEVRARIAHDGGEPLSSTPAEHAADIDADETKWGGLVRKLGLRAD
jgi:tripartite-type tricarboxylate transporter receptor subunit TctC